MKTILFLVSLFVVLISCERVSNLKTTDIIPGGCNLDNKGSSTKGLDENIDTVTYSIENDNLKVFVGFNATCCGEYSASSQIKDNLILITIETTQEGICDCICYYTWEFTFNGTGENFNYKVTIDNRLTFTGKIKH